nr:hypothetical protein BgiMline_031102 [Biomphalaria glabrata]
MFLNLSLTLANERDEWCNSQKNLVDILESLSLYNRSRVLTLSLHQKQLAHLSSTSFISQLNLTEAEWIERNENADTSQWRINFLPCKTVHCRNYPGPHVFTVDWPPIQELVWTNKPVWQLKEEIFKKHFTNMAFYFNGNVLGDHETLISAGVLERLGTLNPIPNIHYRDICPCESYWCNLAVTVLFYISLMWL